MKLEGSKSLVKTCRERTVYAVVVDTNAGQTNRINRKKRNGGDLVDLDRTIKIVSIWHERIEEEKEDENKEQK